MDQNKRLQYSQYLMDEGETGSSSFSSGDSSNPSNQSTALARLQKDGRHVALVPLALPHTIEFLARLLLADKDFAHILNQRRKGEGNALHFAIKSQDVQLVRFCLDHGADPNMRDERGYTPLHIATMNGNSTLAKLLLDRKADANVFHYDVWNEFPGTTCVSPLHMAARQGDAEVAEQLIRANADVDITDPIYFWTPLLLAVVAKKDDMVRLLLSKGARVDGDHRASTNPLLQAVYQKNLDMVQLLFCCGADLNRPDKDGEPAIHTAAHMGSIEIVKMLLGVSNDDLNLTGGVQPAWWYAQRSGHVEIERLLKGRSAITGVFPQDLVEDSGKSIGTIGVSKVLRDISRAQDYIYRVQDPSRPGLWKERVRFVVEAKKEQGGYDFEVIEPYLDGQDSQEPFLEVSYCWATHDEGMEESLLIKAPTSPGSGTIIRATRARSSLIRRSLDFAHSRGIHRIWIDQECIHQDDPEDKKLLVATMHLIYRRAALTLAILGKHIQSAQDVEALERVGPMGKAERSAKLNAANDGKGVDEDLLIICGRILDDKWFERSWTTQEALTATSYTKSLTYLIEWDRDFDLSGSYWQRMAASQPSSFPRQTVPRNLIIDQRTMLHISFSPASSAHNMSRAIIQLNKGPGPEFTLSARDLETRGWHKGDLKQYEALAYITSLKIRETDC